MLLQVRSKAKYPGYRVFVASPWPNVFYFDPGDGRLYPFGDFAPLYDHTTAKFAEQGYFYMWPTPAAALREITDQVYAGEYDAAASAK